MRPNGSAAHVTKVSSNEEAVRETYKIVNMLSPNFINRHNGFNFDLRCLAASSAMDPVIGPTFSERRLGNVGVGIFWKLANGIMVVDSMYTAGTEPTGNWTSLALAKMSERFDLPPKMDSGDMSIEVSDDADVREAVHSCRGGQGHDLGRDSKQHGGDDVLLAAVGGPEERQDPRPEQRTRR